MKNKISLCVISTLVAMLSFGTVFADEPMLISTREVSEPTVIAPKVIAISSFKDVDDDFWAVAAIERWKDDEVIKGYLDNTYKPNNAITRAEFVSMLDRIFVLSQKADLSNFKDVDKNAWYYENMAKAVGLGIIKGYSNDELAPNALITRQEAMTIISRILSIANYPSSSIKEYIDSDEIASWAKDAIALMTNAGYLNGYEDGSIRPTDYITRAEAAKVLDKTFSVVIREPGIYDLGEIDGNVVVVSKDVVIVNSEIAGGVYVGADLKSDVVTTKDTNVDKEVVAISEEEEVSNSSSETHKISSSVIVSITTSGDVYTFAKDGRISANSKLTVMFDGTEIITKISLANESTLEDAIRTVFTYLDDQKVINTVKANQNSTVLKYELMVAATDNQSAIESSISGMDGTSLEYLINRTLNTLNANQLIEIANSIAK